MDANFGGLLFRVFSRKYFLEDFFVQIPQFGVRNLMKFFQQLLVAPAALGLLAPVAQAAELNIAGVSDYATQEQVISVT